MDLYRPCRLEARQAIVAVDSLPRIARVWTAVSMRRPAAAGRPRPRPTTTTFLSAPRQDVDARNARPSARPASIRGRRARGPLSMHIAIVAPIAGQDVLDYLDPGSAPPVGYTGAPLTGILIGELLRMGHRVTGITTDGELPLEAGPVRHRGTNFTLVVCPARRRAWRFNGRHVGRAVDLFALERRSLASVIREAAPDIVHAHWTYEFALAAIDTGLPHLITCHDLPEVVFRFTRSPYRALRWLMAKEVFGRGRAFTTVSTYMAEALTSRLGHAPRVVPNPVASQALARGRTRCLPQTRRVAMVCNGWDRLKNPKAALLAFASWRRCQPGAEFHLFGHDFGPGQSAQLWASASGLSEAVVFHGHCAHGLLIEQLDQADVLVHPALHESFGVVLAEAMALGIPVVAGHMSGGVSFVVGGSSSDRHGAGLLTDVRSPSAISDSLSKLFEGEYEGRSEAGRSRAQMHFSPRAVAGAYENAYVEGLTAWS